MTRQFQLRAAVRLGSALLVFFASTLEARAAIIGPGDFAAPTLIDFEAVPSGPIGAFYSPLGVTFARLDGGSFFNAGILFSSGFDRIVIDTSGPINASFAIDDFRFEGEPVPEPSTLLLLGAGLLAGARRLRSVRR